MRARLYHGLGLIADGLAFIAVCTLGALAVSLLLHVLAVQS